MKSKIYRVFMDVRATDKSDAVNQVMESGLSYRVQEDPFNDEEEGVVLELARMALADAEVYDRFAEELDLTDRELKSLQKKIEKITNR